jgi:uncharacterized membrane protein
MGLTGRLARILRTRPRLWISMAFGGLVYAGLAAVALGHPASRLLVAWNACALLYLALALHLAWGANTARMHRNAVHQGEGRALVLVLVVVAAVAVLLAVGSQLATLKQLPGAAKLPHAALAALTVITSWLFTQTLFAINYAHDFYLARAAGRPDVLIYPGTTEPTYADFFYFACIIGTSGQTADVAFNGSALRKVGTLHCVLAFGFNTMVLALTINIAAGLF